MATIIDTIRSMAFDELNEVQQKKAFDVMRELDNHDTTPWWSTERCEEAVEDLIQYGIQDAETEWSGFASQGDGASISTDTYINLETFLRKLKKWSAFRALHRFIAEEEINARVLRTGARYSHKYTVYGNVEINYNIDPTAKQEEQRDALEDLLTDFIRDKSQELYDVLDKENDYHNSDEAQKEAIVSNGYEFKVNDTGEVLSLA